MCVVLALLFPLLAAAQEWTEAQVIEKFLSASPYAREVRARVASVQADLAGRTLLPNPSALASREGAGYAAFFQIEQQLPLAGRRAILKQAGEAAASVTEAEGASTLWTQRSDLRAAFYRLLATQGHESELSSAIREMEEVVGILRKREELGEGSRYDRLRTEREVAEYRSQLAVVRSEAAHARTIVLGFLPPGTAIERLSGVLDTPATLPLPEDLARRALLHRSEYLAEQRQLERSRLEARAADRLRIPEPVATAGLKRGEVSPGRTENALAFGISVPLPMFNRGQTEVARWSAEQERASARMAALERRISAEVRGTFEALRALQTAIAQYRDEAGRASLELNRIARTAYQEGAIGILELLDSYRTNQQSIRRLIELQAMAKETQIQLDRAVGEEVLP